MIPANATIIDKGSYTVTNEQERDILAKFIYELAQGNELYKPESLHAMQRTEHTGSSENRHEDNDNFNYRNLVNFV